jgi:hypothetical protein
MLEARTRVVDHALRLTKVHHNPVVFIEVAGLAIDFPTAIHEVIINTLTISQQFATAEVLQHCQEKDEGTLWYFSHVPFISFVLTWWWIGNEQSTPYGVLSFSSVTDID